jgi:RNA polymerase sigma factor (sigma-70 family)
MAHIEANLVLRQLHTLLEARGAGPLTDEQLLQRFTMVRDESAFAELLRRHGPMVLGVCRRTLPQQHDAEDAFQATFLALVRGAASIRRRQSLGGWLYRVAQRLSRKMRADDARRRAREKRPVNVAISGAADELTWRELRTLLDDELARLPEKHRLPLLLCYLGGQTQDEAARQLGWGRGTLKRRLERGRELLRRRLARRGVTLPAALCATMLAEQLSAAVPPALATATIRVVTGDAAAVGPLIALAESALTAAGLFRLKIGIALLLAASLTAAGAGMLVHQTPAAPSSATKSKAATRPASNPPEDWAEALPRTDRYGDPLPAGALARMGSTRFRHGSWAYRVVFAHDGKTLISAGADRAIRFWEASTGKQVRQLTGHAGAVYSLALSPDGKVLASVGDDENIRLWDAASGKEIRRIPAAAAGRIAALTFSPDGKTLASGSSDKGIGLWDPATGRSVRAWAAHSREVSSLVFSADGKTLASGGWDDTAALWKTATAEELRRFRIEKKIQGGLAVALSPDGKVLAAGGLNSPKLYLWDTGTGKEIRQLEGKWGFLSMIFSSDSQTLLTGGQDGSLRLWDVAGGKEIRRFPDGGGWVLDVAFSPDGKSVAAVDDRRVRLWEKATGKELVRTPGSVYMLDSIALSPDSKFLATASHNAPQSLRLWETATGRQVRAFADEGGTRFMVISPDGKWLASAGFGGIVFVWEATSGKWRYRWNVRETFTDALVFTPDGKTLIAAGSGPTICRWDLTAGKPLPPLGSHDGGVKTLALSPDGKLLASGGWDRTNCLWDVAAGKLRQKLTGQQGSIWSVAFSPDGTLLASASCKNEFTVSRGEDRMIRLWDVSTGQECRHFGGHRGGYYQVAFSPDGRTLASAGEDGYVRLWEVRSGLERHRFAGHRGPVASVAFSTDGAILASGSSDTTALIWDIAGRLRAAHPRPKHLGPTELDKLWADLAANDGAKVDRAIGMLAASPQQAVPFLQSHLPRPPADPRRISRLVADLDSDQFDVREQATRELEKLGPLAEPSLRKALGERPALEARRRMEGLLEKSDPSRSPTHLRLLRTIEVLEYTGTPEAREMLATLAAQGPERSLSAEARAALKRLTQRGAGK